MDLFSYNEISSLYHVKPIGIGTANVESLSGYMKRLAEAYMVSVGILIRKVIIPNINRDYLRVDDFAGNYSNNINTLSSDISKAVVKILETRTYNDNLIFLTMGIWRDFLHPRKMFREYHAWCPICYEERLQRGAPIYEELIWNFNDVETCIKHQVKLVQICPYCNCRMKILSSLSRVGYCDKCNSWLGLKSYKSDIVTEETKEWDNWVYKNVGQLLSDAPTFCFKKNDQFRDNLNEFLKVKYVSQYKLARVLKISKSVIQGWIAGNKPTLSSILKLSYISGYSVRELLTEDIKPLGQVFKKKIVRKDNIKNNIDKEKIKIELHKAIELNNGLSLSKFCQHNGIVPRTVKKHFPKETKKLLDNYNEYKKNCKIERHNFIISTMHNLHNRGIYPGRKALIKETGKNLVLSSQDREIWTRTLKVLGYNIRYYNKI